MSNDILKGLGEMNDSAKEIPIVIYRRLIAAK